MIAATAPLHQRATGELRVSLKPLGSETVLDRLRQSGCLRARFPRRLVPGWIDVVTLNTSGGIAGGDRLDLAFDVGAGTRATIAGQAAERFYRRVANGAPSVVRTSIVVASGGMAEWLPQETILFDQSGVDRRLDVSLSVDARFLGVEALVFGRAAMGETVRNGWVRDVVRVRRGDTLLLRDAVRLDGRVGVMLHRAAVAADQRAIGTLLYVAPDAESRLDAVRDVLRAPQLGCRVETAASAWNGMLIARIVGPDGASVRRALTRTLEPLRDDRPLPRVWMC